MAGYLGELNALHPFREGNGRAEFRASASCSSILMYV